MRPSRKAIAVSLLGIMLGAVLGIGSPGAARAQKTPVDCSGHSSDCFTYRRCTQWVDHQCMEITTDYWYWYN